MLPSLSYLFYVSQPYTLQYKLQNSMYTTLGMCWHRKNGKKVKVQWSGGDCTFKISLLLNMVLPRSTAREAWPNQVSRLLDKPCMKLCIEWCLNKHWKSVCLLSRCLLNPGLCIIGAIYVNSERDLEFCHLNVQKNIWPYKIVTYFTRYLFAVK